jgi:acetyl-CoA carboxylase carboxyltransferase component
MLKRNDMHRIDSTSQYVKLSRPWDNAVIGPNGMRGDLHNCLTCSEQKTEHRRCLANATKP